MDRQTMQTEVKKALSETVLLSNGRYGFIITEIYENGQGRWKCHICSRFINTERAMLMHLSHPLHMNKLRAPHHPPINFTKTTSKETAKRSSDSNKSKPWGAPDSIDPGEPIPPGMEDVMDKVCQIQDTIDQHAGPLVGIEYIVELASTETESEPKYICLLCEKKGDPRSVMVHLSSHNHALRYISCFFRTAGNALNMIPKMRENRKAICMAVQKIAEQIEKAHGRLKPVLAAAETFTQQKYDILRSIDEKEHFRETPETTFVEYCTPEKIKEYGSIADSMILHPKLFDEHKSNQNSEKSEKNRLSPKREHLKPMDPTAVDGKTQDFKLSFSIGKPERSLGRNKSSEANQPNDKKEDDEVIYVGSSNDRVIEVNSMSPISSASDGPDRGKPSRLYRGRTRSRSRSRGAEGRGRPYMSSRHRSPPRRRLSPVSYRDRQPRYRSRSRSRSHGRYYPDGDKERSYRKEIDRIYSRDRRSRSKERPRYEPRRYRRSISMDRNRKRLSPYRSMRTVKPSERSPPYKSKHLEKSPEPKKKKTVSDFQVKMAAYRAKLHDLEVEMDNKLKYFRERPEKHPQYSEEWKSFWNKRYKELQQSGKDPNGYDFKPEWIVFWDDRVKQLHEEELAMKKEDLKDLIPSEEKGPSSDLQDVSPPTPEHSKDVTVDDIKNTWKALTGSEIKAPPKARSMTPESKSPIKKRSPSPWEDSRKPSGRKAPTYIADPPIVHCLRMLSVIEQQLGSLGPKALDLLSKAIILEKIKPNESMQLLQEPDIHIFFETVKEKIRGQLIAGIVVRYLVNSCRSLITTIENMLASNPFIPKPSPKPTFVPIQPEPVKVAGVGMVNKMAVAQQIAEVLISQGRTDVSQQELEELINAVVGIASTSNANVNQPSAAFISQLDIQNSTADPHINELLSNLIASAQKSIVPAITPSVIAEKPVEELKVMTETAPVTVPLLEVSPSISSSNSSKAFSEAVSAAKALSEQTLLSQKTSGLSSAEKHLFPIKELSNKELPSLDSAMFSVKESVKDQTSENELSNPISQVSDDDLKERLMKFKGLSRDEQQSLIALLKDLEGKEPSRVEKLRKYVTVGLAQAAANPPPQKSEPENSRLSPFSSRTGGINPAPEDKSKLFPMDSDNEDDDDYTVEDIYKSVSEKLKKKENERKPDLNSNQGDVYDENSGSSRLSNPPPPRTPLTQTHNQTPKPDNRFLYSNSSQETQSAPHSLSEPRGSHQEQYQAAPPQSYPPQTGQRAGWPKDMYMDSTGYPPHNTEGSAYPPNSHYKPSQPQHYQGYPSFNPGTLPPQTGDYRQYPGQGGSGGHERPPYPPQYGDPQQYPQQQQPNYNNQGGPPPAFNYQRPQGQNYYGNYRQY